jgi:hypothetical protein
MTREEFEAFLASKVWTIARSMPTIPHAYIVRGKGNDPEQFRAAVEFIRANGYWHQWRHLRNQYFDVGEHFYWTMGAPVEETIIINRAKFTDYPNRRPNA